MYQSVVPAVLHKYGLVYRTIHSVQKGYRNESYPVELQSGQMVNLLFYKRESHIIERIYRADQVSAYAALTGLPVRTRFDKRLLRLRGAGGDIYVGLYHYLFGQTISWEGYTKKHIKLLGWAMSDLHEKLQLMPVSWSSEYTVATELSQLIERMQRYFINDSVQRAMREKLGVAINPAQLKGMRMLVDICNQLPNQQVLHMDMVRGNVLFGSSRKSDIWQIDGVALTGIIDFEKTSYGHPLFDIARTLAFLLVDCQNKTPSKLYKYFLYSGYTKRGAAQVLSGQLGTSSTYMQLLDGLVKVFLLYDFYKFLRHTPYESLAENHHYVRTHDILLNYAMIGYL